MTAYNQPARSALRVVRGVGEVLAAAGSMAVFAGRVLYHAVFEVVLRLRYRSVVLRHVSDIVVGAGALIAGGGMIFVVGVMSLATGATVGLEGFDGLRVVGAQSFTGVVASAANVREIAPVIFGVALASQVGAGFTAEIGAMRISDEIDALESMSIPSLPYLVATRVIATLIALVPLYFVGLFASFFASRLITVNYLGLAPGLYDHYFHLYLPPTDIFFSVIKVAVFAVAVTIIHTYYGYYASGGPAGVGVAVGRAIRMSIVALVLLNLLMSFLFWGTSNTVSLTG